MAEIRIGNAPCSWGTLEFSEAGKNQIGYQQMLDELRETGYTGTELGDWGYMPVEPDALRAELEKRDLTMLGAFVPVALKNRKAHGEGQDRALKTARLLAAVAWEHTPFLVLADDNGKVPVRTQNAGRIRPDMALSGEEWKVFSQGAQQIAHAVKEETGLPTVFHHHCAGYIETPSEIDRFLSMTDPDVIGLVFDTGHYVYGAADDGKSLLSALNRYADRIWYVHFKDCDANVARQAREKEWDYFQAIRHGVFGELGKGCVDFPGVVNWLQKQNYKGWIVVEQDVLPGMGTPKQSAHRNREYLASIFKAVKGKKA